MTGFLMAGIKLSFRDSFFINIFIKSAMPRVIRLRRGQKHRELKSGKLLLNVNEWMHRNQKG